jgi:probable HAF family extracellular repeat protein
METTFLGRAGVILAAAVGLLAVAAPAGAAGVTPTRHELPGLTGTLATAKAINNNGQVVGTARAADHQDHTVIWRNGKITKDLGTAFTADSINDRGELAGQSWATGTTHASIWRSGKVTDLGSLRGGLSYARGINNRGDVSGYDIAADGTNTHAVLWHDGKAVDLGSGVDGQTFGYGVNDNGDVVGGYYAPSAGRTTAVVWRHGTMTQLGVDGEAVAINNRGDIVINTGGRVKLWRHGKVTDLGGLAGGPRGFYAVATAINDRGDVSGSSDAADGRHGVIWHAGRVLDLGDGSNAFDINNRGQAVGTWQTGVYGDVRAVLWS